LSNYRGAEAPVARLDMVRRFIRDHMDEPLRREVLAAVAGFSVSHLQRLFSTHLGMNPGRYVRRARLERAGRKLRMGAVDITEVALAAGYETHAAFTKAFRQRYGLTPRAFRDLDCWTATRLMEER
jgi:AraC family transcriptional regulator